MSSPSPPLPAGHRVVVSAFGETPPDAIERFLQIEEQQPPQPGTLGPRDVIVRVRSAAVGWVDLLMLSGQYQHMASPPYTPGIEYSGEVVWVGSEARGIAVGDGVMADGSLTGPRSKGSHQRWGGFASYAVAPDEGLLPLPATLSFDQGCNLLGNYETAYYCLVTRGALQSGETVLIHGASGSTGLAAVQLAKLLGARVIATGRSADKLAAVAAQGADHVVRVQTTAAGGVEPFRDQVKGLTDGQGVDLVYDSVGGAISVESLRCVRFGARFLIVGWAATPFVAKGRGQRGAPRANQLPTNLIMMKGLDVLGSPTVISTHRDPSLRAPRLERILGWVDEGKIAPRVAETYPLSRIHDALRAKWQSRFVGGCVIHPGS